MYWLVCLLLFTLSHRGVLAGKGSEDDLSVWESFQSGVIGALDGKEGKRCPKAEDMACPRAEVTFWLYTRNFKEIPFQLNPSEWNTVRCPWFLRGAPLKVLIHGYTMDKDTAINQVLRPAYLARGRVNVISVDWSPLCRENCYREAAQSVPTVGHCVATMVSKLLADYPDFFSDVHVLGHSLGAHVAVWASRELDLPRLTEFDPALPMFTNGDSLLKKGKAAVVDVWHSNSDIKGRDSPDGTVDIYFNDEMDQPGCNCDPSCSHLRAVEYYEETISGRRALTAFPCPGGWADYRDGKCKKPSQRELAQFGEHMTRGVTGVYLSFTNPKKPFIIYAAKYLSDKGFRSFLTHDEDCPKHDFISFFADLFGL